jgi:hypothetical protein
MFVPRLCSSPLTISSGQAILVKPRCHIPMMDHIITVDNAEELEIHSTWLDWRMTLQQLFNYHDGEQINEVILELRSKITGEFDASQLLQRLDNLDKPFLSAHWLFSSQAAMIVKFLLQAFISFAMYKQCCAKSTTELPVSMTLSAPASLSVVPVVYPPPTVQFHKSATAPKITIINS